MALCNRIAKLPHNIDIVKLMAEHAAHFPTLHGLCFGTKALSR